MKGFFLAILCVCSVLLGFVSCNETSRSEQSVAFDTLAVDTVCPLFKSYEKPACHLSVKMCVPAEGTDPELAKAVEHFISLLPKDGAFEETTDGSVQAMVQAYLHSYVMQYLGEGQDAIDSYGEENIEAAATWMSYEENVEGSVLYNANGLLSYQVRVVSYTGGAHGNTKTYNGVFNLATCEPLMLASLFDDVALPDLNNLLRLTLVHQFDCETLDELAAKQIFFDPAAIEATENFFISDDAISWLFDPYDIAPYSTGEIIISLSWDEVYSLLRSDAPCMKLAKPQE